MFLEWIVSMAQWGYLQILASKNTKTNLAKVHLDIILEKMIIKTIYKKIVIMKMGSLLMASIKLIIFLMPHASIRNLAT